jgi:hypothetical protein
MRRKVAATRPCRDGMGRERPVTVRTPASVAADARMSPFDPTRGEPGVFLVEDPDLLATHPTGRREVPTYQLNKRNRSTNKPPLMVRLLPFVVLMSSCVPSAFGAESVPLRTEALPGEDVWLDPAIGEFAGDKFRVTIWFDEQFLGDGAAYLRRTKEFEDTGRTEMRRQVLETLKSLNQESRERAGATLDKWAGAKQIWDLTN